MAEQDVTHTLVKLDGVTARQINQNFRDVQEFVNGQVVHTDGTNLPFTVTPTIVSTSPSAVTQDNDLTNKAYVDDAVWNTAWGVLDVATKTADEQISTTTIDVSGLSVSWTAVTGRRYKLQLHARLNSSSASALGMIVRVTDSSNNTIGGWVFNTDTNLFNTGCSIVAFATPSAGLVTYKVRASSTVTNGFEFNCSATIPAVFSVEDVGPV